MNGAGSGQHLDQLTYSLDSLSLVYGCMPCKTNRGSIVQVFFHLEIHLTWVAALNAMGGPPSCMRPTNREVDMKICLQPLGSHRTYCADVQILDSPNDMFLCPTNL